MLRAIALPAFQDNYIWLLAAPDGECVVVDPGDAGPVLQAAAEGLRPVAVLLTHHHPDHAGGVEALCNGFGIAAYAPEDARITAACHRVADGDVVDLPSLPLSLAVMAVPGHTRSHVAFHGQDWLFCGDALFSLGCGRMFEGNPAQFRASLERLAALPAQTRICCGHEYTQANGRFASVAEPENPARDRKLAQVAALRSQGLPSLPTTVASERECNPFLRLDSPELLATLSQRLGRPPADADEAFATLRAWKDVFTP